MNQNNQHTLFELGYLAYRSENGKDIIICRKNIPYTQIYKNIECALSSDEIEENNTPIKLFTLVSKKLKLIQNAK